MMTSMISAARRTAGTTTGASTTCPPPSPPFALALMFKPIVVVRSILSHGPRAAIARFGWCVSISSSHSSCTRPHALRRRSELCHGLGNQLDSETRLGRRCQETVLENEFLEHQFPAQTRRAQFG